MPIKKLTADFAEHVSGVYTISNNTWNNGGLTNGKDYTQSATFDTAKLTSTTQFTWDWTRPAEVKVFAYPEIILGYKAWSEAGSTKLTSRVADLKTMTVDFDIDIGGTTDGFNIAIEFWLTSKAKGTGEDITTEVMVWLHNPEYTPAGNIKGTYKDGGYSSKLWVEEQMDDASGGTGHHWRYIAMQTDADFLDGKIDLHDVLVELQRKNLVDENDYITGFEFGAEVFRDDGSLKFNSLGYDFVKYKVTEKADTLTGTAKDDNLWGRGGGDTLKGAGGRDHLHGGSGNDTLVGGAGKDMLDGGRGKDIFRYTTANDGGDKIRSFSATDQFEFEGEEFGQLDAGLMKAKYFHKNATGLAHDSSDRFILDIDDRKLHYDSNGNKPGGDKAVIAEFTGSVSLSYLDFTII